MTAWVAPGINMDAIMKSNVKLVADYSWVRERARRIMVGLHVPDNDQAPEYAALVKAGKAPEIFAEFNARAWVRELKKDGVQAFYFYNKCHRGNAYYPSRAPGAHVHNLVKEKGDIFGQLCDACLAEDIVPLAVYEFSDLRVPNDHPDWCHKIRLSPEELQRHLNDPKTKSRVDYTDGQQGMLVTGACLNGPYGDYAIEQARETVRNYPIQGYYVDFLGLFTFGKWVCPYCAPRFKADLGFDFEGVDKMTRRQKIDYIHWHYAQNAEYIKKMRQAINDIRPDLPFVHNFHGGYAQTGLQTWKMAHELTTFTTGDLFVLRAGQLQVDWKLRGYVAASQTRPAEALLDSLVAVGGEFHTPKALDSYRAELWTARAQNVACVASFMPSITGTADRNVLALVKKVFDEQSQYETWLADMEPEYNVGILRSGQTLEFHDDGDSARATGAIGESQSGSRHELEFQGWCQALIQGHYLWDVVHDHLVTADYLRRFKVIILPHAACLSASQCRALQDYVRGGGRVIASGETSLCDESGSALPDFALAPILGVNRRGPWQAGYDRLNLTDRLTRPAEPWVTPVLTFTMGQAHVRSAPGARVLGEIMSSCAVPMVPTLTATGAPGLIRHRPGRGQSLYFAGLPGMQYRTFGVDTLRRAMVAAVGLMLGKAAPVELDAPGSVALYAHRQPGKNRLVVNLVNWIPGCSRTSGTVSSVSLADDRSRHLRFDETARMPPSGDVVLRLRAARGKPVRKVYLAPGRRPLRLRRSGNDALVTVPSFDVHAMVVAE